MDILFHSCCFNLSSFDPLLPFRPAVPRLRLCRFFPPSRQIPSSMFRSGYHVALPKLSVGVCERLIQPPRNAFPTEARPTICWVVFQRINLSTFRAKPEVQDGVRVHARPTLRTMVMKTK
jgi:hypothetical protein